MNGSPLPATGSERNTLRPRSETETHLVAIWEEVLNVRPIGPCDDFFQLGGDSLSSTLVLSHASSVFSVALPPYLLLEKRTVADLAVAVVQRLAERVDAQEVLRLLGEIEGMPEPGEQAR